MGLIYMRISPSGGKYIGQTIQTESSRWGDHAKEAYNPNSNNYNTILAKAIRKYGKENFNVVILESNVSEDCLDEREIYWIDYYKTFYQDNNHGYNMTRGGGGQRLLNINTEDIEQLWQKGLTTTDIAKQLNCGEEAIRNRLFNLGYTTNELIIHRNNKAIQTRYDNHYDKELILSLWNQGLSIAKISTQLNQHRHGISNVLSQCGVTDEEKKIRQTEISVNLSKKPILQFDKNNNFIKEWESLSEASRQLNLSTGNICMVLKGKRKTAGGFKFKYKGE